MSTFHPALTFHPAPARYKPQRRGGKKHKPLASSPAVLSKQATPFPSVINAPIYPDPRQTTFELSRIAAQKQIQAYNDAGLHGRAQQTESNLADFESAIREIQGDTALPSREKTDKTRQPIKDTFSYSRQAAVKRIEDNQTDMRQKSGISVN